MKRLAINCPSCGCLVEGDYCESCVLWREESDRKIQNLEAELQAALAKIRVEVEDINAAFKSMVEELTKEYGAAPDLDEMILVQRIFDAGIKAGRALLKPIK